MEVAILFQSENKLQGKTEIPVTFMEIPTKKTGKLSAARFSGLFWGG
jgi:hypothetical protein